MIVALSEDAYLQRTTYFDGRNAQINVVPYPNYSIGVDPAGVISTTAISGTASIGSGINRVEQELKAEIHQLRTQVLGLERIVSNLVTTRRALTQVEVEQLVDAVRREQQATGQVTIWDGPETQIIRAVEKIHGIN